MTKEENNTQGFKFQDYNSKVQEEMKLLINIEKFLTRVKEINGDEAFQYVAARQYLAQRAAMLKTAEEARLSATAKSEEAAQTPPSE